MKIDRQDLITELRARGVGTSVHFIPVPLHPAFAKIGLAEKPCRQALELYPRIVSLPLYPAISEDQIRYVAQSVKEIVAANRCQIAVCAGAAGEAEADGEPELVRASAE